MWGGFQWQMVRVEYHNRCTDVGLVSQWQMVRVEYHNRVSTDVGLVSQWQMVSGIPQQSKY